MSAIHQRAPAQDWTEADKAILRQLWPDKSASVISDLIESRHSRNAVISKAHRMSLPGKAQGRTELSRNGRHGRRKQVKKLKPAIAIKPREFRDMDRPGILTAGEPRDTSKLFSGPTWEPLPGSNPVLLELRKGCAWPLGESPFTFCNLDVDGEGQVYCVTHRKIGCVQRSA